MVFGYLGGAFLGWGLGANDSANVFGTAVSSRMVRYRTAVILIAIFVVIGAWAQGAGGVETLRQITVQNQRTAIVCSFAAAIAVLLMTLLKLPISTSQAVVGSIVGVGLLRDMPVGDRIEAAALVKVALCWVGTPVGGMLCAMILYLFFKLLVYLFKPNLILLNELVHIGLIVCGCYGAYALGANNVANVCAVFVGSNMIPLNVAVLLGGGAIAVGALTFSRRVMKTVGKEIVKLDAFSAFISVLAHAVVVHSYAIIGVPVSTSQAIVGAVLGIGLIKGLQTVRFRAFTRILVGWLLTPTLAGGIAVLIYFLLNLRYTG